MTNIRLSTRIYGLAVALIAILIGLAIFSYTSLDGTIALTQEATRVADAASDGILAEREYTAYRIRAGRYLIYGLESDAKRAGELAKTADAAIADAGSKIRPGERKTLTEKLRAGLQDYFDKNDALMKERRTLTASAANLKTAAKTARVAAPVEPTAAELSARAIAFADAAALAAAVTTQAAVDNAAAAEAALGPSPRLSETALALVVQARDVTGAARRIAAVSTELQNTLEEPLRKIFAEFRTKQMARADDIQASVTEKGNFQKAVLLGISVLGVLIGLVVAFVLARSIIKPLDQMTRAMDRLSRGDGSVEIPGLGSSNEIGAMAAAVDVFKQNADKIAAMLKAEDTTREIGAIISKAAAGDLTVRVGLDDKTGFLRDIGEQVNQLLETSNAVLRDFGEKAKGTAISVTEASQAIGQVSDGAKVQNQWLAQVATAVKESMLAIKDVSDNTRLASEKAEASTKLVEQGLESIANLSSIVDRIAQNSRKVNQITQVIAQIANRTHILSLNAAIEAARAGEHGKGFVVVAQEVGKLAESAGQNANQIAEIVEQAGLDAQAGKAATGEVRSTIEGISTEARTTMQMIHSSATAIEEQRATVTQIDGTVSELKSIANSNTAAAEEITATMIQLSRLSDDTRRRIEAFKTA